MTEKDEDPRVVWLLQEILKTLKELKPKRRTRQRQMPLWKEPAPPPKGLQLTAAEQVAANLLIGQKEREQDRLWAERRHEEKNGNLPQPVMGAIAPLMGKSSRALKPEPFRGPK